jgi:hypothetical protein
MEQENYIRSNCKKFPAVYGNQDFVVVYKVVSLSVHTISFRVILILSFQLTSVSPEGVPSSGLPAETLHFSCQYLRYTLGPTGINLFYHP